MPVPGYDPDRKPLARQVWGSGAGQEAGGESWSTPVGSGECLCLVLSCWASMALLGLIASGLAGMVSGLLVRLGTAQSTLPVAGLSDRLCNELALFVWDSLSSQSIYRLLVFCLGYAFASTPLLVYISCRRLDYGSLFGPDRTWRWSILPLVGLALIVVFAVKWAMSLTVGHVPQMGYQRYQGDIFHLLSGPIPTRVPALILSLTVFPLIEEILFRGLLFRALKCRWGTPLSLALSSLLFGLWHFAPGRLWLVLQTAAIGLVLAVTFALSGNLWVAIIAHGLHNLIVFYLQT